MKIFFITQVNKHLKYLYPRFYFRINACFGEFTVLKAAYLLLTILKRKQQQQTKANKKDAIYLFNCKS